MAEEAKEHAKAAAEKAKGKLSEAKEAASKHLETAKGKLDEATEAASSAVSDAKEAATAEQYDANMPSMKAPNNFSLLSGAGTAMGVGMTALVFLMVYVRRASQHTTADVALNEHLSDAEAPVPE